MVGGELSVERLKIAYTTGIFPWPISEHWPLAWFSPKKRAVLFFDELKEPRSWKRDLREHQFSFQINQRFSEVISLCAQIHGEKSGTWITKEMRQAYTELHEHGFAHSVETYKGKKLVGGLYGVSVGKMFAGESMFHIDTGASKFALLELIAFLRQQGVKWIDCQMSTPHLSALGAREIERDAFLELLSEAISGEPINWPATKKNNEGE